MTQTLLGVFKYTDDAERALSALTDLGYEPNEISVVMKDIRKAREMQDKTGVHVAEGAASGVPTGGAIGGIVGLLTGTGAIAIPGLGAILIGGPIAAALGLTGAAATTATGALTGALAGGLLGALVGLGIPEEEAKEYVEDIQGGGILLAVPVHDARTDEVKGVMETHKARGKRQLELPSDTAHLS
jgi:hypothetical protein